MTHVRTRKLIDNLERVALDLHNYILDLNNKSALLQTISEVQEQYTAPLQSWIWWTVYYFFRVRPNDFQTTKTTMEKNCDPIMLLEALVAFFSKGEWKSTSANSNLLFALIKGLPNYTHDYDAEEISPVTLHRLSELFVEKANFTIQDFKKNALELAKKEEEKNRLVNLPKEKSEQIKTSQNKLLQRLAARKKPIYQNPNIEKLNKKEENVQKALLIENMLKSKFGLRSVPEKQPPLKVKTKEKSEEHKKKEVIIENMLKSKFGLTSTTDITKPAIEVKPIDVANNEVIERNIRLNLFLLGRKKIEIDSAAEPAPPASAGTSVSESLPEKLNRMPRN